ncbi:MAG: ABC transporter permease [Acidimicrobiales bacterium]
MALVGSAGPLVQWSWVSSESGTILSLLAQHVELTVVAVAVGFAVSLPLGVLGWKVRALRPAFTGFAGLLYVIPSIALLSLVAPLTGFFSVTTAEVALVSYTLLVFLRNIIAGLSSVPADAHEAARGMGYTAVEELFKVQLPLALPSILAGLRVATVTTVGLVNVTALIGQGGLGQLIIQGFNEDFNTPIVVGLVLSVALAGLADALLVGAERLSLPWLRAQGRER